MNEMQVAVPLEFPDLLESGGDVAV